jgi:mono/diheme cytochrome c family protein
VSVVARPGFALVAALLLGPSCTGTMNAGESTNASEDSLRYLSDPGFRRTEMVASLVNPQNRYSQRRLAHYESGDAADWARLPEWNPRVAVVSARQLDGAPLLGLLGADAERLVISDAAEQGDDAALVALGEAAFFRYPVQLENAVSAAASSRAALEEYGFWVDDARGAGGLVRVELEDGSRMLGFTCATCHAARRDDRSGLVVGVGNDRLDLGRLMFDVGRQQGPLPEAAAHWLTWGPGRLDVTTTDGGEPVRIGDLRPVRWLTHLHADASLRNRDLIALAIRIETLMITSGDETTRPPRAVALGLAAYVRTLADTLPAPASLAPAAARGRAVFQSACAECHEPPAFTGPPVPLDVVGTDPTIGVSLDRGTGTYRVPSLRGVSTRGALLHDASLPDLDAMFDPARVAPDFTQGRRAGAVPGHAFGLGLDDAARSDLIAYVSTL